MTLLQDIEQFCERNDIRITAFGRHVMSDAGFVGRLRIVGQDRIREATKERCTTFMCDNPDGGDCPRINPPKKPVRTRKAVTGPNPKAYRYETSAPNPGYNRAPNRIDLSDVVALDRTPCFNCGVSADIGCHHQPKSEPVRIA
jgi:hypothetical protein